MFFDTGLIDYDLFNRNAEISALGGGGHCHSHKSSSLYVN